MAVLSLGLVRSDGKATVLAAGTQSMVYAPYGFREQSTGASALGFNGQLLDRSTGRYLLGNGQRTYNPALMRFQSPDSLSPFGKGGVNAYAYCLGDPVNGQDPSGHAPLFGLKLPKLVKTFVKESRKFRSGEREIAPDLLSLPATKVPRAESVLGREMEKRFHNLSISELRLVAGARSEQQLADLMASSGSSRIMKFGTARDDYQAFKAAAFPTSTAGVTGAPTTGEWVPLPLPDYSTAAAMPNTDPELPTYAAVVRGKRN
jgi:RHS repeat-associated protein